MLYLFDPQCQPKNEEGNAHLRSLINPLDTSPNALVVLISRVTSSISLSVGQSSASSSCKCRPFSSGFLSGTTLRTTFPIPKTSEYVASPILASNFVGGGVSLSNAEGGKGKVQGN